MCGGQLELEVGHLGLHLPLALPLLDLLRLDVHEALLLTQRQEEVSKLGLDLTENK